MRKVLACISLFLLALVASGCGGSGSDRDEAAALLKETFGPGHPINKGKLDLKLRVTGKGAGLDSPLDLTVKGPFDTTNRDRLPRFALELGSADTQGISAGVISTGRRGFVTAGGQAFVLSEDAYRDMRKSYEKTQRKSAAERKRAPGLAALGVTPATWLADAQSVVDGEVMGTPTRQVSAGIDVEALLADVNTLLERAGDLPGRAGGERVPGVLDAKTTAALERSVKTARITVDAGRDDKTLRRMTLRLQLEVAEADREQLDGLQQLDIELDLAIGELGRPQQISDPKDARPISELTGALAGLAGGATGETGGEAESGRTQTDQRGAETSGADRYSQCLAEAGEDVAKIQQCAPLVGR